MFSKRSFIYFVVLLFPLFLFSCGETEPENSDKPDDTEAEHLTLVYAVNRSSLRNDFSRDSLEMMQALDQIADPSGRLLVYYTDIAGNRCGLHEAVKRNGRYALSMEPLREYPRDITSTHPSRIKQVIEDALSVYPDIPANLFFWGHGTSWTPEFSDNIVKSTKSATAENIAGGKAPIKKAYGGEYAGELGDRKNLAWTDVVELAAAIPSGRFETIWFDCCYMSSIEILYEFRDKCRWFVGYPTEVWQYGLPYDLVLPLMYSVNPRREEAAKVFFDYYCSSGEPVTVAVSDMSRLEYVADVAARIFALGKEVPSVMPEVNYSRDPANPYYDFLGYCSAIAEEQGRPDLARELDDALHAMVSYYDRSPIDFRNRPWDIKKVRCVSIGDFNPASTDRKHTYYRTTAWYRRTR